MINGEILCLLVYRRFPSPIRSTARYRCLLLCRRFTSSMINGEIPMSSIIQMVHFADDQRRDIDAFYYTDGSLHRLSTARYRCLLLCRRFTSSMINGEIPMSSIIQMVHFADDPRRDIDAFYYTDGSLRRSDQRRDTDAFYYADGSLRR